MYMNSVNFYYVTRKRGTTDIFLIIPINKKLYKKKSDKIKLQFVLQSAPVVT